MMKCPKKTPLLMAAALLLTSCGFLPSNVEGYYIEDVNKVSNADGSTTITFTFSDPEIPPMVIDVPAGQDGLGIASITHVLDTESDPDRVILTITYSDEEVDPTVFYIPVLQGEAGNGIYNVTYEAITDPESEHYLDIEVTIAFTDPSMPDSVFYVPHGNGIVSIQEDSENWSPETGYYYIVTFEDGQTIRIAAPQGEPGVGISSIDYEFDETKNVIRVTIELTSGEVSEIEIPAGNRWHVGSGLPASSLGVDGDYYFDTATGNIHRKNGNVWELVETIDFTNPSYTVTFLANGGYFQVTPEVTGEYMTRNVTEGTYLTEDMIPVPLHEEGKVFDGYWTCADGPGPFDAKLTLLTPITRDLTLYAHWAEAV